MRKFDVLYDFDTALVSAAAMQQTNTINVTHIKSGKEKPFQTRTLFKAWLKENLKWVAEDFTIADVAEVTGEPSWAVNSLKQKIIAIKLGAPVKTVKFVVGGPHGNFRDSVARIRPYKGQRGDKPLLFNSIKRSFLRQCADDIVQPSGSWESDDVLSMYLYDHIDCGEKSTRSISSPDKDLAMCVGWHTDPNDWDAPAVYTTELQGFRHMLLQSLQGDVCDNIQGIPTLVDSVQKRFGLRKTKGFAGKSAEGCLAGAETKEDLIERVVFVYKETFKEGCVCADGSVISWIEALDETMQLLKMLDYEDQVYKFSEIYGIN